MQRYNPDLQKRSLENRQGTQQDFDDFVGRLKQYSRSDKPSVFPSDIDMSLLTLLTLHPVWEAAAEAEARMKESAAEEAQRKATEIQRRREEIKRHSISPE